MARLQSADCNAALQGTADACSIRRSRQKKGRQQHWACLIASCFCFASLLQTAPMTTTMLTWRLPWMTMMTWHRIRRAQAPAGDQILRAPAAAGDLIPRRAPWMAQSSRTCRAVRRMTSWATHQGRTAHPAPTQIRKVRGWDVEAAGLCRAEASNLWRSWGVGKWPAFFCCLQIGPASGLKSV